MTSRWDAFLSSARVGAPQRRRPDTRMEFEVDHDRIVFSRAFRRLQDKTQVHPFAENDHVRRRLMHSIEAGSVGRSLGRRVGLALAADGQTTVDPAEIGQVVQNACIVHDIGNPPYGHSGEAAIRDWFRGEEAERLDVFEGCSPQERADLQTFEGNAHGLRVVARLENYSNAGGMRLTAATLGAFLKYPWGSADPRAVGGKFGFFESEREVVEAVMEECGVIRQGDAWARHPLVYLVEAADDVCYALADLEDGVELGVLG
ncbi:MAG: dGTP triphosphohydrolase, partial [Nannocystaceae bacterium]